MGWIGNIFLVVGIWLIGCKRRTGFLCALVGELLWTLYARQTGQWSLIFICIVFDVIYAINYWKWRKDDMTDETA
jgi:hypothetical protein